MLTTSDLTKLLLAGMKTEFMKEFAKKEEEWQRIAVLIKSGKETESYAWLGSNPDVHEWVDERIPEALSEYSYSIKNLDWESSISVDRNVIRYEQYGQTNLRARQLANKAKRFWGRSAYQFLSQGYLSTGNSGIFNTKAITCYDGNPFFYGEHEEGSSGSQSNKGVVEFSEANLRTALTTMRGIVDDKGEKLDIHPNLLVVSSANEFLAREILNSTYFPTEVSGGSKLANNVMKGVLDLYVSSHIDDNDWFVFDTSGVIKPMILQTSKDVEFTSLTEGIEHFMRKKLFFGVDFSGMLGWGLWQYAYGSSPDWDI